MDLYEVVDQATKLLKQRGRLTYRLLKRQFDLDDDVLDDLDASITPDLVSVFQAAYPRCLISASTGRSDHLTASFMRRELDVVVTALLPQDTSRFEVYPILREPFILVTAKGQLDPEKPVMDQLDDMPFVAFNDTMPLGRLINQQFRRVGMNVEKRVDGDPQHEDWMQPSAERDVVLATVQNIVQQLIQLIGQGSGQ